jgi:hypothetical protein
MATDPISSAPPSGLRNLLGLAAGESGQTSLPAAVRSLADLDERVRAALQVVSPGAPSVDAMFNADVKVERLRQVKNLAKHGFERAGTGEEQVAIMLLYHAAIASAYGFHGEQISTRPMETAIELYDDLGNVLRSHPLGVAFRTSVERFHREWEGSAD